MIIYDDSVLEGRPAGAVVLVRPAGRRRITHAIHDIDGTHSLIRQWQPVMSVTLYYAMHCGLEEGFDSPGRVDELAARAGREPLEETDRFCVESAGLAALTQMEFAIRRAVQMGNIPPAAGIRLSEAERRNNSLIIQRIWAGEERFEDVPEPAALLAFINDRAPRLFKLYEQVLNKASRQRNLEAARRDPAAWRVPGAIEFMRRLRGCGVLNYFVTGSVVNEAAGMCRDVEALGYDVGPGRLVEQLVGCPWDRKLPKAEVMADLCRRLAIDPANVLVLGDGRSEIKAGADMGCVTISRLDADAARLREVHARLGTNLILPDYTDPVLNQLFREGER